MDSPPLSGAVALVTGASSGVGAATARRLARDGAAVGLVARRGRRLEALAEELGTEGQTAMAIEADLTEPDRAADVVQVLVDRFERLDVLVNNAGIMLLGTALHASVEDWGRMIALNVEGLLHVTHAAVPHLIAAAATSSRGVTDIVNVSSTAGRVARPGSSVYNLTKFGLNGFTEALRQELLVERVRVGVVEPGTVDTELLDHLTGPARDAALQLMSGIEPLRPEDVADAIAYVVTQDRRVAVNEILVRAGGQSW
ncbi:MAG: SDR family NAD(P)-dependent oxidoreductase [Nocardioides sp.]